jgi:hypothetical protein
MNTSRIPRERGIEHINILEKCGSPKTIKEMDVAKQKAMITI